VLTTRAPFFQRWLVAPPSRYYRVMPLRVGRRHDRNDALTISGTIRFADGSRVRIQRRASTDYVNLAREEAAALEAKLLRADWHGPRRPDVPLHEAIRSFAEAKDRSDGVKRRLHRILMWMVANECLPLVGEVDQDFVNRLRHEMLRPNASPATVQREVVTPLSTVVRHAKDRGWCDVVRIEKPTKAPERRTNFLMPAEAERLIEASADHLKPLILFLIGTGARLSEALELEWRDVDLAGGRAIVWADQAKSRRRRVLSLPVRVVSSLQALLAERSKRQDQVFLTHKDLPYTDVDRTHGGQIKTGFKNALKRANLASTLRLHDLRHTWATWQYALTKDPLRMMTDGGWTSMRMVERYSHLMPVGFEDQIRAFFALPVTATQPAFARA
jgi:integrase